MEGAPSQLVFSRSSADYAAPTAAPAALRTKEVAPFLKNLRRILEVESRDILRWTDDGKAFEIHDLPRMMTVVLPKYFKHAKYASFQRQLNYFNFRKWTKSKAVVCTFSNPFFVRDQPSLAWRITRKKSLHQPHFHGSSASSSASSPAAKPPRRASPSGRKPTPPAMVIKVPAAPHTPSCRASYPSPTDAYSMDSQLGVSDEMLDEVADLFAAEPPTRKTEAERDDELLRGDSLDWIDALYSSLDVPPAASCMAVPLPPFQDHALDFCAQV